MRIVDRKAFLKMPAGTVFAKFDPHIIRETMIKGDTVADVDFYCSDLTSLEVPNGCQWIEQIDLAIAGESVPLDFDVECRDGCFDMHQLFAVWEQSDIDALMKRLQRPAASIAEDDPNK
jgi:hypothetical protein